MMLSSSTVHSLIRILDLGGVVANAILAGALARSRNFDVVGFAVLAVLSGLGGGVIRDTLLQHGVPVALTDYRYLVAAFGGAAFAFVVRTDGPRWQQAIDVVDALALGLWAAAGAEKTLSVGLGWWPAVLLGTITAVGGGFVRDVVLGRVPGILGGGPLYATCAAVASGVLVACAAVGQRGAGTTGAIVIGGGLRLLALRYRLHAPMSRDWGPRGEGRR